MLCGGCCCSHLSIRSGDHAGVPSIWGPSGISGIPEHHIVLLSAVCRYGACRVVRPAGPSAWRIGQSNTTSLISSSNNGLSTSCRSAQSNLSSTLQSSHRYGLGCAAIHCWHVMNPQVLNSS